MWSLKRDAEFGCCSKAAVDCGFEGFAVDGFGEVVGHAGGEAAISFTSHGTGGEGDDGHCRIGVVEGTDLPGGFEAVEVWHL